ncbi:MAG: patatin family protein [Oscillospiraceae bacterium]|nr:patatin family protein [Oscillospiraceae bacterium]
MQKKTGLVLEGGAMRGLFTAGVLDVMMEQKLLFDGAIGVSAGACFGCNYKSGQIGRSLRYNLKYCKDKRYCSVYSLLKTGDLYGAEFCYHTLPETLDRFDYDTYRKHPMEFHVVCTDIETGKPVYHAIPEMDYEALEWIRASASMPMVSRVVEIGGRKMLDGGMTDPIPLAYFESRGYGRNVVILTQPREYRKESNKTIPMLKIALRNYPKAIEVMRNRHTVYNQTTQYVFEAEKAGRAFVICPPEALPIKRITRDAKLLQQVYEIGRSVAIRQLPALRSFLQQP